MWNFKKRTEKYDANVRSNDDRKGDFRFADFVFTTVKIIFCAEAEC